MIGCTSRATKLPSDTHYMSQGADPITMTLCANGNVGQRHDDLFSYGTYMLDDDVIHIDLEAQPEFDLDSKTLVDSHQQQWLIDVNGDGRIDCEI